MSKKKKILYGAITIIAIALFATLTVLTLNYINNKNNDNIQNQQTIIQSADDKILEAAENLNVDTAKAKELLSEARIEYETQGNQDAIVDIDAQLYYIEHVLNK